MKRIRPYLLFLLLASLSIGTYLFISSQMHGTGFPLDDSWIHQTYARNLALRGEWSFIAGQPSAGLTAPLWPLLLAPAYWFGWGPFALTFIWGVVALAALGVAGWQVARYFLPEKEHLAVWVGVLLVFEWHLVWAGASGMETLLQAILVLAAMWLLFHLSKNPSRLSWLGAGLLVGVSAWVRPEGITLAGPLLVLAFLQPEWRERIRKTIFFLSGFVLSFAPYLWFNRWLAGAWWPNTFYAKQAEYVVNRAQPLLLRIGQQLSLPLIGVGLVLLPGIVWLLWRAWKEKRWPIILGAVWFLGMCGIYAFRLPVTYQHGRYLMPAMPVYFVWGAAGMFDWIDMQAAQSWKRLLSLGWTALAGMLLLAFWGVGGMTYANDVGIINTEMVAAAQWVADNTAETDLIAAHDIGALGYFAQRPLVDLAGLVSPEVIPFIRDEEALVDYLNMQQPKYLVTFPDWYQTLPDGAEKIYSTGGAVSPAAGGTNMSVYIWLLP